MFIAPLIFSTGSSLTPFRVEPENPVRVEPKPDQKGKKDKASKKEKKSKRNKRRRKVKLSKFKDLQTDLENRSADTAQLTSKYTGKR